MGIRSYSTSEANNIQLGQAGYDYVTNAETLLTLYEYIEIAKRCIGAFASDCGQSLLNDDDAVAHVAEHLMLGHLRWKEDGGRTLYSYLNQCAIWAIKSWKNKLYQTNKQHQELSLNASSGRDEGTQLYQFVSDKIQCYRIVDGEFYEITTSLKKVKR